MILVTLLALLVVHGVSTEDAQVIGEAENGEVIPMTLSVKDDYVVTVSGLPDQAQPFYRQSINLYDFDKQLEARKVVQEGVCYIKRFTGTFDHIKTLVKEAHLAKSAVNAQVSEDWNIPGDEVKSDDIEKTLGTKIPVFCSGYKVFWMRTSKRITKRQAGGSWSDNLNLGTPLLHYRSGPFSGTLRGSYNPLGGSGTLGFRTGRTSLYNGLGYDTARRLSTHHGIEHDFGGGVSAYGGLRLNLRGGHSYSAGIKIRF